MNDSDEEVLKRHEVEKPGLTNQKKSGESMAKALRSQETEIQNLKRYVRSLEDRLKKSQAESAELQRDDYGGLERILEKNEEDGKDYIIGLRSKNNYEFYLPKESPKYHQISDELDYVKDAHDELNKMLEKAEKDSAKKKKERDRAFSRAVSAEKKLENFIAIQGFYVGGDCQDSPLPFKVEAEGRYVAEVRADHGKIMICKNKNSAWFFEFGDVYVEGVALSQTNTKGIELKPDDRFKVMWSTEHEMHEECYYLKKLR